MTPTEKARQLRRQSTDAERKLWTMLRDRQLAAYKFRRQVPLGAYIVDFVCFEKKLIIELDGSQHLVQQNYDDIRTRSLESAGFTVLRFWNNQVSTEPEAVCQAILQALEK